MKIVCSCAHLEVITRTALVGADLIELRLDLMAGIAPSLLEEAVRAVSLPVILTIRSTAEFGAFQGAPAQWMEEVDRFLHLADYVDIEQAYQEYATRIKGSGKTVIASFHTARMPTSSELADIERDLRRYGDIVKIAARPESPQDLVRLFSFTLRAEGPIVVSIVGEPFRWSRAVLPHFGSKFVYCSAGIPTAGGQYSLAEMMELSNLLSYHRENGSRGRGE